MSDLNLISLLWGPLFNRHKTKLSHLTSTQEDTERSKAYAARIGDGFGNEAEVEFRGEVKVRRHIVKLSFVCISPSAEFLSVVPS